MKYNRTSFMKDACKGMTFSSFKATYSNQLTGHKLEDVFTELGGKLPKKAKKEEE